MSYTKTNWVDNTTPINSTNMNKIEQGIYDNSLVADAVNNVVKPNDETYKDVEITEGQITDVLGVNDVLIKGQTLQDGEPTPDSPVDVNVVSGSNVISTSNKNIWKMSFLQESSKGIINNENFTITENSNDTYLLGSYSTSAPALFKIRKGTYKFSSTNSNVRITIYYVSSGSLLNLDTTFDYTTLSTDVNIVAVRARGTSSLNGQTFGLQLELGQTATTYEAHQGKELPLDLPVENLFDTIKTSKTINGITYTVNVNGSITLTGTSTRDFNEMIVNSDNVPIINAGTYTKSAKIVGTIIKPTNAHVYLTGYNSDNVNVLGNSELSSNSISFTTTTTADINTMSRIGIYCSTSGVVFDCTIYPMIEKGSKANTYTPYGTTPIELCKIGDYQDYFYRDNGKWYLHKEIGKIVLDGTENDWSYPSDNRFNLDNFSARYRKKPGDITYFSDNYIGYNQTQSNGDFNALVQNVDYGFNLSTYPIGYTARFKDTRFTTVADFKAWLSTYNILLYCVLEEATDTEITDTTLINQLEAIYNAPLYEQTNITQTNNDLPIVLDITACKDNINGIKAWIRK